MVLPISSTTVSEGMPRGPGATAATAADAFLLLLAALLGLDETALPVASGDASTPEPDVSGQAEKPEKVGRDERDALALAAMAGALPVPVGVAAPPGLGEGAPLPVPEGAFVSVQTSSAIGPAQQQTLPGTREASPSPAPSRQQTATNLFGLVARNPAGTEQTEVERAVQPVAVRARTPVTENATSSSVSLGSVAVTGEARQDGERAAQPQQGSAVRSDPVPPPGHRVTQRVGAGDEVLIREPASVVVLPARPAVEPERATGPERADTAPSTAAVSGAVRNGPVGPEQPGGLVAGADVTAQVQDGLSRALERGARQIRVRLEPPDLGVVDIRVREIGGRLEVTLAASRPEVHQALDAGREGLRSALAASGFTVQRLEVQPGYAASGQGLLGGGQPGAGWSGGQHGFASDTGSGRWSAALAGDREITGNEPVRVDQADVSGLVDTRV
ncbi:MAG: flagellar hook-length control protein FliK [Thermomicrobium sp.]|nr:flagellar hook-length control protein FliK [Thermomicrobium sp.]